jgi:excinuclease ABC subunit C
MVRFLERSARSVETIVTRTEKEALLLEDELIKRHQPPHNVRLKDDKSFLMIRVDLEERFPRLKFVRAHRPRRARAAAARASSGPSRRPRRAPAHRRPPPRRAAARLHRSRS